MNTNIAGDTKRHPILDTTGTVRKWLTTGRGVAVWTSHDIRAGRALTPADHVCEQRLTCASVNAVPLCRKPHWAYMPERALLTVDDALFYLPGRIVKSWTDGPAGYKAAYRALAKYPDETREAPIGTVYTTYALHRYAMVSAQISPDGTVLDTYGAPLAPDATGPAIPTDVEHRIGIRMWNAIDHAPATGNAKRGAPLRPIASGAYPGIRPLCVCGHYDASHEALMNHPGVPDAGPCHAPVAGYGTRCDCQAFVDRNTTLDNDNG